MGTGFREGPRWSAPKGEQWRDRIDLLIGDASKAGDCGVVLTCGDPATSEKLSDIWPEFELVREILLSRVLNIKWIIPDGPTCAQASPNKFWCSLKKFPRRTGAVRS